MTDKCPVHKYHVLLNLCENTNQHVSHRYFIVQTGVIIKFEDIKLGYQ